MKKHFSDVIAEACRRRGISYYALAKRLGVTATRVQQIAKSKNITERTLTECADALDMRVEVRLVRKGAQ